MSITIRQAIAGDDAFMRDCAESAYALYVPRMGKRPAPMDADYARAVQDGHARVVEFEGTPIGYGIWWADGNTQFVENIAILPLAQGGGFGRALMDHIEQNARAQGLASITLYTNEKMVENVKFYDRLGFGETGRRVEHGFNRIYMSKLLR